MPDTQTPNAPKSDDKSEAQRERETRAAAKKALEEQQKSELPTNDWPGKGAH